MYQKKMPVSLNCGLDIVAEILYGKWKIRLLYFIHEGYQRPSELQRKIPDATRRVLDMQLRELEKHELIFKTVYAQVPPKVEYNLTPLGSSLMPIVNAIGQWGDEHQEQLKAAISK